MSDEEWDQNVGSGQWDKERVEAMRVPCRNILEMIIQDTSESGERLVIALNQVGAALSEARQSDE